LKSYVPHLKRFGIPEEVRKLVSGAWKVPAGWDWWEPTPTSVYPFTLPPALIPFNFQAGGDCVLGAWRHWFAPDRRLTYVHLFYDGPFHARECARTPAQLVALVLIRNRLGLGAEARRLLKRVGIPEDVLPEDEYEDLSAAHPVFGGDWPLGVSGFFHQPDAVYGGRPYTGDFPRAGYDGRGAAQWYKRNFPPTRLRQCCGMEIAWTKGQRDKLKRHLRAVPPWLTADADQPSVFDALLGARDYAGAWMSLNSSSWLPAEAVEAMGRLAAAVDDKEFGVFAKCWTAANRDAGAGM
jgi:hypothetical protein